MHANLRGLRPHCQSASPSWEGKETGSLGAGRRPRSAAAAPRNDMIHRFCLVGPGPRPRPKKLGPRQITKTEAWFYWREPKGLSRRVADRAAHDCGLRLTPEFAIFTASIAGAAPLTKCIHENPHLKIPHLHNENRLVRGSPECHADNPMPKVDRRHERDFLDVQRDACPPRNAAAHDISDGCAGRQVACPVLVLA